MPGRPTEHAALRPGDHVPGPVPCLIFSASAGPANTASTLDGASFGRHDRLKGRNPGDVRRVPIPRYVADALDAHLAAGYASGEYLFTSPEGGPLRWGNVADTYGKPAVQQVLGRSSEPLLRDLELRWLRKAAITWLLRSGMTIPDVAHLAGHHPTVLLDHYAGVVAGHDGISVGACMVLVLEPLDPAGVATVRITAPVATITTVPERPAHTPAARTRVSRCGRRPRGPPAGREAALHG